MRAPEDLIWADWKHFLIARWRLLRRVVPFLRTTTPKPRGLKQPGIFSPPGYSAAYAAAVQGNAVVKAISMQRAQTRAAQEAYQSGLLAQQINNQFSAGLQNAGPFSGYLHSAANAGLNGLLNARV